MSITPIDCGVHSVTISYVSPSSSSSEKICMAEDSGSPNCYESFKANVGSTYHSGKLSIQGNDASYDELKQRYEIKDSINWKLEARGVDRYELTKSVQHSTPDSQPMVSGRNAIFKLMK